MLTVGVDLAAEPARTAVASIDWSGGRAAVREVLIPADDERIVDAVMRADKTGIDCPFGWPMPFIDFLLEHRDGHVVAPEDVAGRDRRRRLAYRTTDLEVARIVGRPPLSVSADRIGHTAMRCAGVLATLAERGRPVDRSGAGPVAEVYPAASLKQWGLADRSYKGPANLHALALLVDGLKAGAPWLDLGPYESACRGSDDVTDAVVAALTARAAWQGRTGRPSEEQARIAATEGWIMLPDRGSLTDLATEPA